MSSPEPALPPPPSLRASLYAALETLPPHVKGQIVDGELIVQPRPAVPHADVTTRLAWTLTGPFSLGQGGPGGWRILFEPELHLTDDVLVPDLAGWRIVDGAPDLLQYTAVPHAPDWVCEVLSPSTARIDRSRKLAIYGREGVAHVWLLDPKTRLLEVFTRSEQGWGFEVIDTADPAAAEHLVEPFDAVALDLRLLWDDIQSPPAGQHRPEGAPLDESGPPAEAAEGEARDPAR